MKRMLLQIRKVVFLALFSVGATITNAQTLEWRLVNSNYDNTDPDGAGPAIASAAFTLQLRSTSGTVQNINTISTGWSYQSSTLMVPTSPNGPGCPSPNVNNPANVTVNPGFGTAWSFGTVNECGTANQTTDGKSFDRRAVGTLEGENTSITTEWVDVMTITMWPTSSEAYVIINSGEGGSPGEFTTYTVADVDGNSIATNSLTYATPLRLGAPLPVTLSNFEITCTGNGAKLNWRTLSEQNTQSFEIEKSPNGANGWTAIGSTLAAGTSSSSKQYEYYDLRSGTAYYRLRQVDKDGRYTYSSVQRVNCITRTNSVLLYPIPTRNLLNIVLATERNAKATLVLVDMAGRTVRQLKTDLQKGTNNLQMNVGGLSSGEYILKVLGSESFETQKVTVIR